MTQRQGGAGRFDRGERRSSWASPGEMDGFVSRGYRLDSRVRLHVRERRTGTAHAAPWLLLHGLGASHRYLMPTARCLTGRDVLVPDLPGFGLSRRPGSIYDVTAHTRALATWLDARSVPQVCLLGHSFGGQVAVDLAYRRPDLTAALVLVGPTVDPAAATVAAQVGRWLRALWWEDVRQAPVLLTDIRDAGPHRVAGTLRHAVRDRIEQKLPSVHAPTLLVRGARDPIVPDAWLTTAAALLPDSRTLVLPGASHNAATTAGPQLAAAMDAFVADRSIGVR